MASAAESPGADWSQIVDLRPELRSHVRVLPQDFRGQRWYLLQDLSSGRYLRVDQNAWAFIGRLDGEKRVGDIHASLRGALSERAPEQDDVVVDDGQLADARAREVLKRGASKTAGADDRDPRGR